MRLIKPHRLRAVLLGALFLSLTGMVGFRLQQLQVGEHAYYLEKAEQQQTRRVTIQAERGEILDRTGRPLAQNTNRLTVYINPDYFAPKYFSGDLDDLAKSLSGVLDASPEELRRRFDGTSTTHLARRVRPETGNRAIDVLESFNAPGQAYWLDLVSNRVYPRHLAASVIGFCRRDGDGDNVGLAGLEVQYNSELQGKKVSGEVPVSNIRQRLEPWEPSDLPEARGNSLVLTLDANIQESVEQIVAETIKEFEADSGGAVVMDPDTGGILALASYPSFDNNDLSTAERGSMRNRILTDPLETGSVMKLFTAAMLLDLGYVTPDTLIDCEGGYAVVDGRRLRDSPGHTLDVVAFKETIRHSSNIGVVKAAQSLENPEWYRRLRSFGFGQPTGVDLPGEGGGILYPVERWTKFSRTSLPMGYEIAVTPIQVAAGLSSLVNGGTYYEPHLVSEVRSPKGETIERRGRQALRRVIRPTTSAMMRDLMEDVVVNGTGDEAQLPGYRIGGKTGTTRKSDVFDRREYIASFGGAFPINDPRAVIYVYIDNPRTAYYASQVAAPAFQRIVKATALHLGIPPSKDFRPAEEAPARIFSGFPGSAFPAAYTAPDNYVYVGRTPDFDGMTMAEARRHLPENLEEVSFYGSGYVSDQFPPAGEPLSETTRVMLHFAPEKKTQPRANQEPLETAYQMKAGERQ